MKILKYIPLFFTCFGLFYACEEEDYQPKSSFSEACYYSSYGAVQEKVASVGDWESFMDISQGAIYHEWSIESGNYFLEGNIALKEENLEQYIVNAGDTTSTAESISVLFGKGDTAAVVRLFNVFPDSASFRTIDEEQNHIEVKAVYQEEGKWKGNYVFDYEIVVDVYDTIVTDMQVLKDGVVVPHEVPDTVVVHVGDKLTFVDLSAEVENTSRPTDTNWKVQSTEYVEGDKVYTTSTKQIAEIPFLQMGLFNVILKSQRAATDRVSADEEEYTMPLVVEVQRSLAKFEQDGVVKQQEDGTLKVPFNALIQSPINDLSKDLFEVQVEGYPSLAVTNVELVDNNQNTLILTLSGKLYPDDKATLVYSQNLETGINSSDERSAESFSQKIALHDINMLGDAWSFEDALGDVWKSTAKGTGTVEYSTEQAATGMQSIKGVNPGTGGNQMRFSGNASSLLTLEKDVTYVVRYKRFLSEDVDMKGGDKLYIGVGNTVNDTQINNKPNLLDLDNTVNNKCFSFIGKPQGEWYTMEFEYTPTEDFVGAYLTLQVNPKAGTFYYDDFYIASKQVR